MYYWTIEQITSQLVRKKSSMAINRWLTMNLKKNRRISLVSHNHGEAYEWEDYHTLLYFMHTILLHAHSCNVTGWNKKFHKIYDH